MFMCDDEEMDYIRGFHELNQNTITGRMAADLLTARALLAKATAFHVGDEDGAKWYIETNNSGIRWTIALRRYYDEGIEKTLIRADGRIAALSGPLRGMGYFPDLASALASFAEYEDGVKKGEGRL